MGKEPGQAVGYLDDGTMVVVDNAKNLIGSHVNLEVVSLLQTSSGRIVFAKNRRYSIIIKTVVDENKIDIKRYMKWRSL